MTYEPTDAEYTNTVMRIEQHPAYAQRPIRQVKTDALAYRWVQPYYTLRQGTDHEASIREVENRICAAAGLPPMWEQPPVPTLRPLSVRAGRLFDGQAYVGWRGISEFSAIHLCRIGQQGELRRRLERAQDAACNGIRVLAMAKNLFDLRPSYSGYGDALSQAVAMAAEYGLYTELVVFADAQDIMPSHETRVSFARDISLWASDKPSVLIQTANEPYKNGWQSATDPLLLDITRRAAFPCSYSIGDPPDYVADPSVSAEPLAGELDILAHNSPILVLHAERKADDSRYAAWVDHLKGFDEAYANPLQAYRIHDEPMGASSNYEPGRRDNRADAHRAACLVAACLHIGYTYHYISEQNDGTPGLDGQTWATMVPQTPDYVFRNAGTAGAFVKSFQGWDKIRTTDNGTDGWFVAYGKEGVARNMTLGDGVAIVDRYAIGPSVELYHAVKG